MQPVYLSPNQDQAETIRALLKAQGIESALVKKSGSNNHLVATDDVTWYELWTRNQSDTERAKTAIQKYEFNVMRDHMKTQELPPITAVNPADMATQALQRAPHSPYRIFIQDDQANWRPVNNQKVFQRLGQLMGFTDADIAKDEFNTICCPWNGDRLKDHVKALQQLCKFQTQN